MNRPYTRRALVSIVALGLFVCEAACSEPDWAGPGVSDDKKSAGASTAATEDDEECSDGEEDGEAESEAGDAPAITGDACCEDKLPGKAHCVAEADLPEGSSEALSTCASGGLCVPDALRGGGTPKSCDSGFDGESKAGVCLSLCVKAVADKADLLTQGTCGKNEVCAPCISPLDGEKSGACELGQKAADAEKKAGSATTKAKKPCTKAAPKETESKPAADKTTPNETKPSTGGGGCCGGKGLCVPKTVVTEDEAEHLEAKECEGEKLCAPKENADKSFKPKTCTGSALTGDYTGVCLSTCLVFGTLESIASEQGSCDSDHRCLPCKYPLIGTDTGAPGCE